MERVQTEWPDFLKLLAGEHPEWAGKLRQGELAGFKDGVLNVAFASLFQGQRADLENPEAKLAIETALEQQFEHPIKIKLTEVADSAAREEVTPAEGHSEFDRHPSALVVQKVFGVNIRHVFSESQQPVYHLGMSSHLNKD